MELQIGGIGLAAVVVALVSLAKKYGLPIEYAPWAAAVLSVVGYALVLVIADMPQYEEPVVMVLNMLIIFLASTGLYNRTIKA